MQPLLQIWSHWIYGAGFTGPVGCDIVVGPRYTSEQGEARLPNVYVIQKRKISNDVVALSSRGWKLWSSPPLAGSPDKMRVGTCVDELLGA